MTTDYRTTYSWKESLDLGPHLVRLAEALPEHETSGLVLQLHQIMLDLPTRVAQDLKNGTDTRLESVYRLEAALELIDRVYPALDTADVRKLLEGLSERLSGDGFSEVIVTPPPAVTPTVDETETEMTPQEAVSQAMESTVSPMPAPEQAPDNTPVLTPTEPAPVAVSPTTEPAVTVTPSVNVAVNDPATVNVQPNSLQ